VEQFSGQSLYALDEMGQFDEAKKTKVEWAFVI
jgi:hypothetical protein